MKIVVIGATGNVGTAVLQQLHGHPDVTSVTGVARRAPDTTAPPYDSCQWVHLDITRGSDQPRLRESLTGADCVIHLAWLIQPNTQRDLLRRVNVDGTHNVGRAAVVAGVPHLVVASSVGVYSPAPDHQRRDESWDRNGIGSSHYSVDKAAQERVLDELEADHPDLRIARLRPALIFQSDAASEIQRYFLTQVMPSTVLGRLPALPLPPGIQVQAVHADDVARAYVQAAVLGAHGAFNICADDTLRPDDLARIVDHGRYVTVPAGLMRAGLRLAHRARAVGADPGWLDMALQVPMLDNTKAAAELDWRPQYTAVEALQQLLQGIRDGTGLPTPALRAREYQATDLLPLPPPRLPAESVNRDLLSQYLADHLAGATAGERRAARMEEAFADTAVYPLISEVAQAIRIDRTYLAELTRCLGLERGPLPDAMTWLGERLGRLKPNGRMFRRSPTTLLLETDLLTSAIVGKLRGWRSLRQLAEPLHTDPEIFDELIRRAEHQLEQLDAVHAFAREVTFRTPPPRLGEVDAKPRTPASY